MTFNESNTVEAYLRDLLCGGVSHHIAASPGFARRVGHISGLGWHYLALSAVPGQPYEVFVEPFVRDALIRLSRVIVKSPSRAEEDTRRRFWHRFRIIRSPFSAFALRPMEALVNA